MDETPPLVNVRRFVILISWIILEFVASFIFANFLNNGKAVAPASFSVTWGQSMIATFSVGLPILVLLLRREKYGKHHTKN